MSLAAVHNGKKRKKLGISCMLGKRKASRCKLLFGLLYEREGKSFFGGARLVFTGKKVQQVPVFCYL
jgi:hypothetical protein